MDEQNEIARFELTERRADSIDSDIARGLMDQERLDVFSELRGGLSFVCHDQ